MSDGHGLLMLPAMPQSDLFAKEATLALLAHASPWKLAKLAIGALDRQLRSASTWSYIGHQVSTYFNWIYN